MIIGNKQTFAFDINVKTHDQLRTVDIYIDNRSVCCDENTVYIPHFVNELQNTAEHLKHKLNFAKYEDLFFAKSIEEAHKLIGHRNDSDSAEFASHSEDIWWEHRVFQWGPTTDNIRCFLIPINGILYLTFEFWRETHQPAKEIGEVFAVEITPYEIIRACETACKVLDEDGKFLSKRKR